MYDGGGNFQVLLSDQIGYMGPGAAIHADPSTGMKTPRMEPSSRKTSYAPQPLSICRCAIATGNSSYVAHPRKVEFGFIAGGLVSVGRLTHEPTAPETRTPGMESNDKLNTGTLEPEDPVVE
jgi:hypothetical protein